MALVQALKTGPEGTKKLEEYYNEEDYYLGKGDERFQLHFDGKIADQLGIKGVADKKTWEAVTRGDFSAFGEKKLWNGKGQHRIGADIGFSAPKSFSIAALVNGDERLIEVHKKAIEACKKVYEEECVVARYGHGSNIWKNPKQALFAHVTHISNRDQEPQLHEHLLILNVTRGEDGQLRKMESKLLVEKQKLLNEIYLQKLAEGARELGYDVEWRKSLNGNVVQPEIKDVSREQIQAFSQRSAEVEEYLKDKYGVNAQEATAKQRRTAALATRKKKEETNLESLRKTWKVEADKLGVRIVTSNDRRSDSRYNDQHVKKALGDALGHFLERESAVQESQLLAKGMFFGREHGIRYDDIKKCYDDMKKNGQVIEKEGLRANKLITDKKSLYFETKLIESVRRGKGQVEPVESKERIIEKLATTRLSDEQKEVAAFLLSSTDRVVGVNGYAGAGKTHTLKPVVEVLKEKGFDVIGLAPSHKAVEAMGDAGITGQTMQSFIHPAHMSENLERMSAKTVIVLDEAGMVSTEDMGKVINMAEKAGARVILSGDIKQHQSVEAGPAFKIVQNIARGDTKFIKTIVRQANAEEAVRESLRDVAEDVKNSARKLLQAGLIKEIENREELYGTVAVEYVHSIRKGVDTVVITETNKDRIEINRQIRKILFNGEEERHVSVFRVKNMTEAEKKNRTCYEVGDSVRFQREYATLDVKVGEVYKVKQFVSDKVAILEDKAGKEIKFDITKYKSFDIGKVEEMPVCVGERIRITDNSLLKKAGLTNGMQGEIVGFGEKTIHVTLENGRKTALSLESAPIDYRYAGTGHSTQGKTVTHEILVRDPAVSDARSFYTDVTRTKKSAVVYTSNTEHLLQKLGTTKEKLLARDAVKEKPVHALAM